MHLRKIVALAVVVASGVVQVDLGDVSQKVMPGESRLFAGDKKQGFPLPSGDVVGFTQKGQPAAVERNFPGLVGALLLTDEQKQKLWQARDETVGSEAVRAAGQKVKSNPSATDAEKEAARNTYQNAYAQLAAKAGAILTAEQKAVVEKINTALQDVQKAALEAMQPQFGAAKGNPEQTAEVQRQFREKVAADLSAKLIGVLTPDQNAAYQKAAADQKAQEEQAKSTKKPMK